MTDFFTGSGLSGIDEQLCAGWPFHGAVKVQPEHELNRDAASYALEGYPLIGFKQLNGRLAASGNYFIKTMNRAADWDYFVLHGRQQGISAPYDTVRIDDDFYRASGTIVVTGGWDIGIPLKTPSGRYLNFNIMADISGSKIFAFSRPRYFSYTMTGISSDIHPVGVFDTSHNFAGCDTYHRRVVDFYDKQAVRYSQPSGEYLSFSTHILDFKSDRLLIALTSAVQNLTERQPNIDVLSGNAATNNYRFNEVGYTASSAQSSGLDIVCIYELVLTGETAQDCTLTLIKSPKQCEGTVVRSSPTNTTAVDDDASPIYGAKKIIYSHSMSQAGVILDAYYSDLEDAEANPIVYTTYDVEHSFDGEHSGIYKGELWQQLAEYRSSMTLGGVTKKYRQVTSHVFDMPSSWSPDMPETGDPFVKIDNKIWEDDELVIEESFSPKNHGLIVRPVSLSNLSGRRAPFAGSDARVGQYGFAYGYPSYDNIFNMRFYSMALRNNGSGTCVMYGVIDSFGIQPTLDNIKIVSDCTIVSRNGVDTLAGFTDTVVYDDPRYTLTSGANTYRYHAYRGYIGSRLKGTVNQITGEYYAMPIDNPTGFTYWL